MNERLQPPPTGWVDPAGGGVQAGNAWRNHTHPTLDAYVTYGPGCYLWGAQVKLPARHTIHRGQELTRDAAMATAMRWISAQR